MDKFRVHGIYEHMILNDRGVPGSGWHDPILFGGSDAARIAAIESAKNLQGQFSQRRYKVFECYEIFDAKDIP